jgi:hypothetical protein
VCVCVCVCVRACAFLFTHRAVMNKKNNVLKITEFRTTFLSVVNIFVPGKSIKKKRFFSLLFSDTYRTKK